MTKRTILGAVVTAALLTEPAAAQYAVRGGPIAPQYGPSLYTGAYAPSFWYGPGPVGFSGPGAGTSLQPNYAAFPSSNPGNVIATPVPVPVPQYYGPSYMVYYPQPPRPEEPVNPPRPPTTRDRSLSTGDTTTQPPAPPPPSTAAHFTVKVPADAKLWANDVEMKETGPSRRFHVPGTLAAGKTYEYVFRAQWPENGQTVTRDRTVRFKPGDDLTVDFTEAPAR
jgi:uncharacterized protein (TIGR03000 family)